MTTEAVNPPVLISIHYPLFEWATKFQYENCFDALEEQSCYMTLQAFVIIVLYNKSEVKTGPRSVVLDPGLHGLLGQLSGSEAKHMCRVHGGWNAFIDAGEPGPLLESTSCFVWMLSSCSRSNPTSV